LSNRHLTSLGVYQYTDHLEQQLNEYL
jgi:hypothetical protein